jgi:PAS domain S-box-containing protein
MSDTGWLGVLAWVLQPGAAVYALRLNRLFGTRRVGWSVCAAFLSLAVLHVIHLADPRGSGIGFVDVLISALLLIGLAHVESVFSSQACFETKENKLRKELRSVTRRNQDLEEANLTLHELNSQHDQAERELKESARQFRSLFLDNPQPMWIFDLRELRFLEVNKAALREYGFTESEFMALTPRSLHPENDLDAFLQDTARPKPAAGSRSLWQHFHKDGALIDVEVTACDLFYSHRPARLILAQNVTRKQQLEKAQQHEQKLEAFAQMAGGFVQQFTTSFIALDERAGRLLKKHGDAEIADELRHIASAASRAAAVTRQLLTLSGKQHFARESLDLNATVKDSMAALQPLIEKHIKVRIVTAANLPFVPGDSSALQQVILNLVLNARESMPSGGTLTISTTAMKLDEAGPTQQTIPAARHFACLTVCDTGSGMTPEVQARLFEPFFTTRTARKAAGLGLATSGAIVKQHCGWMEFTTELERGSEFRVFLPAAP